MTTNQRTEYEILKEYEITEIFWAIILPLVNYMIEMVDFQ